MKTLVVVPAYNEEACLPTTLEELQALPADFEVLIVNDGSSDATGAIAEKFCAQRPGWQVVHLPVNCGIGVAVQTGYLYAAQCGRYTYVVQLDADGQHDPTTIPTLVQACQQHQWDLCIGSRFLGHQREASGTTRWRRLGIRMLQALIHGLSGVRLTDPTSGLRCAAPAAWKRFAREYPDDYPEPESAFWAVRSGLRVGEVPVTMRPRRAGASSIRRGQSLYYMAKVSLAILLDRLRAQGR